MEFRTRISISHCYCIQG